MAAELEIHPVDARQVAFRRVLPEVKIGRFDPFLVLHEQGPIHYAPGEAIGFPDHPHRGFETVTYVIAGEQQHTDSFGHTAVLHAGDVQWMTAGRGIVHSELPTERVTQYGGFVHAVQLWVNLPSSRKMERPRYQDVTCSEMPLIEDDGRWIRLIAGSCGSLRSPIQTGQTLLFAHVKLGERSECTFPVPRGAIVILYAMSGDAELSGRHLLAHHVGVLREQRGEISVAPSSDHFEGLVFAATPLKEPIVSRGPFVMNSRREIAKAYDDLLDGTLGTDVDGD
jgi:redox-sensitive bicupin YhaK (pirin superfamily)